MVCGRLPIVGGGVQIVGGSIPIVSGGVPIVDEGLQIAGGGVQIVGRGIRVACGELPIVGGRGFGCVLGVEAGRRSRRLGRCGRTARARCRPDRARRPTCDGFLGFALRFRLSARWAFGHIR